MRLLERTLQWIEIAPREVITDVLGGVSEGFSDVRRSVRASVIPSAGKMLDRSVGVERAQTMCMLLPLDARIETGDGVCVDSESPNWRCVDVQRWSAHIAAQMVRIC